MIVIAHCLSTVRHCDTLFFLKDSRLIDAAAYDHLVSTNGEFAVLAV